MAKQSEFVARAAQLANAALTVGGILSVLAFVSSFYYYTWTRERHFVSPVYLVVYYFVPLSAALVLFASLRLHAILKVKLVLVLVSLTASLYGLELFIESTYTSLYASTKPVMVLLEDSADKRFDAAELTKKWGSAVDLRTATEVIADFQQQGVDAVPITTPSNHLFISQPDGRVTSAVKIDGTEVLPLAAVSHRVTLLCNESGQWIDYESDERGFNNPNGIWSSDHLEIAALGDSFTHGYCVPTNRNFVALIREHSPATLNLGVAGDGPLLMLATLQEYLPRFRPKIVLWFYYEGNDLTDLQIERKSALLRDYLKDGFSQTALAKQDDIDREIVAQLPRLMAAEGERRRKRQSPAIVKLVDFAKLTVLRQRLGVVGGVSGEAGELAADLEGPNMDTFREAIVEANRRSNAWGGKLHFVYLPEWARYTRYTSWGKSKRNDVLTLVRSLGIPIIDIAPAFETRGDPLSFFPFRGVGHYNEAGHRVVAEAVLQAISKRH